MDNRETLRRLERLLAHYQKGTLTHYEIGCQVFDLLTDENLHDILPRLPDEVTALVKDWALQAPKTDQEWADSVRIGGVTTIFGPGYDPEKARVAEEEQRAVRRRMCEALRARMATEIGSRDHETN